MSGGAKYCGGGGYGKHNQLPALAPCRDANALERSLIQHVVLCWLRLHDCELRYHTMMGSEPTIAQANYWEKKLSANQARYLRAVETLARVRKLELKVQINVAGQQIVAG